MNTPNRIAIIAALPREVRLLTARIPADATLLGRGIHLHWLESAIVVAAGMGAARASFAFEAALASGPLDAVISVGLAGSCKPSLLPDTIIETGLVIDARTGERFRSAASSEATILATTSAIASVQEKARLAGSYGASLVDMEAATVARLARAHGLPFRAIKGISDAHDFELASLSRFEGRHGKFRTAAFALHTALRPHHWRHAARLGRESNRALALLCSRLREILSELG